MKRLLFFAVLLACAAGCMNVEDSFVRSYPPTSGIQIYYDSAAVPHRYSVMGTIQTSGNYNDYSFEAMREEITKRGEAAGADAILVLGVQIVPDGTRVTTSGPLRSLQANDPALNNTIGMIDRDFDGGYGAINNPNYGLAVTYNRVVRAEFLHYETDENGNRMAPEKDSGTAYPVRPMSELKKEAEADKALEKDLPKAASEAAAEQPAER